MPVSTSVIERYNTLLERLRQNPNPEVQKELDAAMVAFASAAEGLESVLDKVEQAKF